MCYNRYDVLEDIPVPTRKNEDYIQLRLYKIKQPVFKGFFLVDPATVIVYSYRLASTTIHAWHDPFTRILCPVLNGNNELEI